MASHTASIAAATIPPSLTTSENEHHDDDDMSLHWTRIHEKESSENPQWPRRRGPGVMLEGFIERSDSTNDDDGSEGVSRAKSLTDDDLEELKGCFDLGFGFSYDEIPELCNTLPALELCYSMSQRFLDEQRSLSPRVEGDADEAGECGNSAPVANWKISSPGDNPDEVKARLKYWAQAVACTVRLCR